MPYTHVNVDGGCLRGIENAGVASFLGVPYAADTSGRNRFRPPQPIKRWEGVRDALTFGPSAPQTDLRASAFAQLPEVLTLLSPRGASPTEGSEIGEDCLHVNIWAPAGKQSAELPVLVWLHGGGYSFGSGNEMAFNGDILAAAGDLVVVTVTHRLGLLGFLDLRELGEAGSANAGILDVVAALEWVQRNIAEFGGDPKRVTICGQSGGSGKVAALNAMPRARGLFSRSIMMSGPFGRRYTAESAADLRSRVMDIAGMSTVDELRSASLEQLLEVQSAVLRQVSALSSKDGFASMGLDTTPGFGPSIDPVDLPTDSFGDGPAETVWGRELMIGWTSHEASFLLANDPTFTVGMTADEATARVDRISKVDGVTYADLVEQFPDEPPHLIFARRVSYLAFQAPARKIADVAQAKASGVWVYEFAQRTEVLEGLLGASHSLDLAYVFGTVDRIPLTGRSLERHGVSRDMMRAWAKFAHEGNPGWEPWSSGRSVHTFGTPNDPRSGTHTTKMRDPLWSA